MSQKRMLEKIIWWQISRLKCCRNYNIHKMKKMISEWKATWVWNPTKEGNGVSKWKWKCFFMHHNWTKGRNEFGNKAIQSRALLKARSDQTPGGGDPTQPAAFFPTLSPPPISLRREVLWISHITPFEPIFSQHPFLPLENWTPPSVIQKSPDPEGLFIPNKAHVFVTPKQQTRVFLKTMKQKER